MEGASDHPPLRLGISRCLLGEQVRWDGDHRHDLALLQSIDGQVEWVPVCPEAELGMGVPREPVQLIRAANDQPRMVGRESRRDWTASPQARGLFAAALMRWHPLLPVEEDERLHDPDTLERFLQRAIAYRLLKSARRESAMPRNST